METRNISIAKKNGYTLPKVLRAKQYLEEIGTNKRNFPFEKLVTYYNDLLGTHDSTQGCRCQSPKYYNGIHNYYTYGKLTLINNGLATEADFELKEETPVIENEAERINLGTEEIVSEAVSEEKVDDVKEEEEEEPTVKKKGTKKKNS
jgi:hypothetical protein